MPKPHKRLLNKLKPHLIQRGKDWWVCNLPGAGRWYTTGDGFTKEEAYDKWYHDNFSRTVGKWLSLAAYLKLRAEGLKTVHPILSQVPNEYSNVPRAPEGNFFTAHQREP